MFNERRKQKKKLNTISLNEQHSFFATSLIRAAAS